MVDGCPVPREAHPIVIEAKRRSGETLNSCYRGKDARPILNAHGKHDQTYLWNGWLRRLPGFNPANEPGFSPHEGFSDGVSPPGFRRGARIPRELVGQDWQNAWRVIAVYRAMSVPAYHPYQSATEMQHVGIARVPKKLPPMLTEGVKDKRVIRLKHLLAICVMPHAKGARYWSTPDRSNIFTAQLADVVRRFQHDHGLTADGIVGHMTDVQLHHAADYWKAHSRAAGKPAKPAKPPRPTGYPGPLYGGDFFEGDGDINWVEYRLGSFFAFIKATEGLDFTDPRFTHGRIDALRAAGVIFGCYHFARPQPGRTPEQEAEHFLATCRDRGALRGGHKELPPVLDIEWVKNLGTKELASWCKRWVQRVYKATGVRPIIYTGLWFWQPRVGDPSRFFGAFMLWLAAYVQFSSVRRFLPKAWRKRGYTFWQLTDKAHMRGCPTPCDQSRFDGSLDDLLALTIP